MNPVEILGPFIALAVVSVGGLVTLERRLTKLQEGKMDLSDHQKICEAHNVVIDKKLDHLTTLIKENHNLVETKHDQTRAFQHDVRNEMHLLSLKLERIMVTAAVQRHNSRREDPQ